MLRLDLLNYFMLLDGRSIHQLQGAKCCTVRCSHSGPIMDHYRKCRDTEFNFSVYRSDTNLLTGIESDRKNHRPRPTNVWKA